MPPQHLQSVLTAEEWNVAYFLGLESIFQRRCQCNVPEQVLEGARILSAAGYRFRHFDPEAGRTIHGYLTPAGVHELPCQEIANGSFDMVLRARGALRWLRIHVPDFGTQWLEGLIGAYDRLHPELAQNGPPREAPGEGGPHPSPIPAAHGGSTDG